VVLLILVDRTLLCIVCVSKVFLCSEVLLSEEENRDLHRRCVEQYDHLRDEFERYKLRAQSVLKNKSSPSPKVCLDFTTAVLICLQCFYTEEEHPACKWVSSSLPSPWWWWWWWWLVLVVVVVVVVS